MKYFVPAPAAVVFDMDGVLVDSERAWRQTEDEYLERIAPKYSKAHQNEVIGIRLKDLHRLMQVKFGAAVSWAAFQSRYGELGHEIYSRKAALIPGVEQALEVLARRGIAMGLASSSPHEWIDLALDRFGLRPFFGAILSGDDVPHGKPAPDIYLAAVNALGKRTQDCWAVEDADVGIRSAKAAGLVAIGFRNGHNDEQRFEKADRVIHALSELLPP